MNQIFVDGNVKEATLKSMNWKVKGNEVTLEEEEVLLAHLQTPPKFTIVRINNMACDGTQLREVISNALQAQYSVKGFPHPTVYLHKYLKDALIVKSELKTKAVVNNYPKIIVGLQCGQAVLRGSNVYAPGVTAIPHGLSIGDRVSVFADLEGKCKRGWSQEFCGSTAFVGNGILVKNRSDLFTVAVPRGLAINMVEPLFDSPSIGDILNEDAKINGGLQRGFLQNLPSLLCSHALAPSSEHSILDMCAAPGGKTTHIAALLNGEGVVIALDKSAAKIKQIQDNADRLGLSNIRAFVFDAVKAIKTVDDKVLFEDEESCSPQSPPFLPESFDRICLDAPCSGLGQRPQLYNPMTFDVLESFPRLQRKLFVSAVSLLKPGGRMVYSTCTYNVKENEEIISWALKKFPCLEVVSSSLINDVQFGQPGYHIEGLTIQQCRYMKRFGLVPAENSEESDTIGFFLCCLEKIK